MERAAEIFHTHTSAHAPTRIKLSFLLSLFVTAHLSALSSVLGRLSLVLYNKHIYTLSLSSLLTLIVTVPSPPFFPVPSLICTCLMPCQSKQRDQHTERDGGGREEVRTDPRRRPKTHEGRGHLEPTANSFTVDK